MNKLTYNNIDEYISLFPQNIQEKLNKIRSIIKITAPKAVEKISYQMPTFYLNGNLVHFASFKNHIGFYPTPSGVTTFYNELKQYKKSKGTIIFPHDKPIPYDLIKQIIEMRVHENLSKVVRSQ